MAIADTILKLSAASGPSGFERDVGALAAGLLAPYMDNVRTDVLGNVIGLRRCGKENAGKLMFDAHLDEIGFIVTGHEEGFLRFAALGGVDARMLPAAELKLLTDPPMFGVVAALPPHRQKSDETDKAIKIEDLFIDVGLGQDEAQKAVPVGTPPSTTRPRGASARSALPARRSTTARALLAFYVRSSC
jgi:endoglucanase